MYVLSFMNEKGGCGKTTSSLNLAGALAARGERVLLVDLDPQGHATLGLGCAPDQTIAEVLLAEASVEHAIVEAPGGIQLLPADERLTEFEEVAERLVGPERILDKVLAGLRDDYDYVLLDCPPRTAGVLAANALNAAHTAVLVVESGAFALQGASKALRILGEARELPGRTFDVRVLGTLFERRTRFARELLIAMQARFKSALYDTVIRTSVRLREAAAAGVPVQVLDPRSRATQDFDALAFEVQEDAQRLREAAPENATRSLV